MVFYIIIFFWAVLGVYWFFSIKGNKKAKFSKPNFVAGWTPRLILIAVIILLWASPFFAAKIFTFNIDIKIIGAIICVAGISFAIWARHSLGKNWSEVAQIKESHELITSGPYSIVRHPIYTGIIFALLGSFIADGTLHFLILFVLVTFGMYMRTRVEEKLMTEEFKEEYLEYKKRTKLLIPWIL